MVSLDVLSLCVSSSGRVGAIPGGGAGGADGRAGLQSDGMLQPTQHPIRLETARRRHLHRERLQPGFAHVRPKIGVSLSCPTPLLGQYTQSSDRRCKVHDRTDSNISDVGLVEDVLAVCVC